MSQQNHERRGMGAPYAPDDSTRTKQYYTELLADPHRVRGDAQMIRRALRQRWPMSDEVRADLVNCLKAIVCTEKIEVVSKSGEPISIPNHRNQAAAARVLVAMEAQNQADDHLAQKQARLDEGKPVQAELSQTIHVIIPGLNSGPSTG